MEGNHYCPGFCKSLEKDSYLGVDKDLVHARAAKIHRRRCHSEGLDRSPNDDARWERIAYAYPQDSFKTQANKSQFTINNSAYMKEKIVNISAFPTLNGVNTATNGVSELPVRDQFLSSDYRDWNHKSGFRNNSSQKLPPKFHFEHNTLPKVEELIEKMDHDMMDFVKTEMKQPLKSIHNNPLPKKSPPQSVVKKVKKSDDYKPEARRRQRALSESEQVSCRHSSSVFEQRSPPSSTKKMKDNSGHSPSGAREVGPAHGPGVGPQECRVCRLQPRTEVPKELGPVSVGNAGALTVKPAVDSHPTRGPIPLTPYPSAASRAGRAGDDQDAKPCGSPTLPLKKARSAKKKVKKKMVKKKRADSGDMGGGGEDAAGAADAAKTARPVQNGLVTSPAPAQLNGAVTSTPVSNGAVGSRHDNTVIFPKAETQNRASANIRRKPDHVKTDNTKQNVQELSQPQTETKNKTDHTKQNVQELSKPLTDTKYKTDHTKQNVQELSQPQTETKYKTDSTKQNVQELSKPQTETKYKTDNTKHNIQELSKPQKETKYKTGNTKQIVQELSRPQTETKYKTETTKQNVEELTKLQTENKYKTGNPKQNVRELSRPQTGTKSPPNSDDKKDILDMYSSYKKDLAKYMQEKISKGKGSPIPKVDLSFTRNASVYVPPYEAKVSRQNNYEIPKEKSDTYTNKEKSLKKALSDDLKDSYEPPKFTFATNKNKKEDADTPKPSEINAAVNQKAKMALNTGSPICMPANLEACIRKSLFPHVPPYMRFVSHDKMSITPPAQVAKHLKWKLTSITPIIVKKTLINSGFKLVRSDCDTSLCPQEETIEWIGIWGKHMKSIMFRAIKENQKMNHFPGTFQIGRKDRLWRNLQKLVARHGVKQFGIMPRTYVLPYDLKLLRHDWDKYAARNEKWIIKPPASARGTGIKVVSRWTQIPKKRSVVVQRYVARPYLINGSKFDIRLYVLVTSVHPLRVYLYKEGLARFASVKYNDEVSTLHDRYMHLTNYSINRLSKNYTANEDADACQGHKWTLKSLFHYMEEQGVDTVALWNRMRDLVIKTIIAGEASISALTKANVTSRYNCYELFGVDVLLDEHLKPWLLEVNISPSLHSASPLDMHVKGPLVVSTLNLAQYHIPERCSLDSLFKDKPHKALELPFDNRLYTIYLSKEERDKHIIYTKMETREEYLADILLSLTPDDVRHLLQAEDELTQATGDIERVFPTAHTHTYHEFLAGPRYYNRLFDAWEHKYAGCRQGGIQLLRNLCEIGYHLEMPPIPFKNDVDAPTPEPSAQPSKVSLPEEAQSVPATPTLLPGTPPQDA